MHTQIDLKTSIPEFILFTNAKVHDVNALDFITFEAGSFYVMDRGYVDFHRLNMINETHSYFITRAKDNMDYRRVYSHTKNPDEGIVFDQTIKLNGYRANKDYPDNLRLVKFYDKETDKNLIFLTNNFELKSMEIAKLYKLRWGIENFFKWLKQHLKVKSFWGQSENAVKTQIWIAVSVYVLVIIVKKNFKLKQSLYEILQVLSISIFEKMPINQLFQQTKLQELDSQINKPLTFWDL